MSLLSFSEIWNIVKSDPYTTLPQQKVSITRFFNFFGKNLLEIDAKRTIKNEDDILPYFNKLLHANGICLSGTWNITEESEYTGYFKKNKKALVIARASTGLSETKSGNYRLLGLAIKLFPTLNINEKIKTENIFLLETVTGSLTKNFTKAEFINTAKVKFRPDIASIIPIGIVAYFSLLSADKDPGYRSVKNIASIEEQLNIKEPKYIKIVGSENQNINNSEDFRNELKISNYNGSLKFDIFVSEFENNYYKKIGYIDFNDSVASESGDHKLHFHHPKL